MQELMLATAPSCDASTPLAQFLSKCGNSALLKKHLLPFVRWYEDLPSCVLTYLRCATRSRSEQKTAFEEARHQNREKRMETRRRRQLEEAVAGPARSVRKRKRVEHAAEEEDGKEEKAADDDEVQIVQSLPPPPPAKRARTQVQAPMALSDLLDENEDEQENFERVIEELEEEEDPS